MKTFNYAKDKSIQLDDNVVSGIIACHKSAIRAHSTYITKDQDLRDSMKGLVQACLDNGLNRSQGGKILAEIVGIEHLKNDRPLANAWQYAAEALPSRQKETNKKEDADKATKPTEDNSTIEIGAEYLAVAVALEQNNINNVSALLISLLTADQLDAVAKRFNDHIASRRGATIPTKKQSAKQGELLKAS